MASKHKGSVADNGSQAPDHFNHITQKWKHTLA